MGHLRNYFFSFFNKKRYDKGVSLFSFWDKTSDFPSKIYLASTAVLHNTQVGKYTRIRQLTSIHNSTIGKYSSISRNVRIGLGEHPTNLISTNSIFYSYQKTEVRGDWVRETDFIEHKPIVIGNDVWIGEFATIKGGVKVGDGAIIASRAFVTKDVPPYAIVGGVPAKIIRYRFPEDVVNKLLEIKWWDLDEKEIEKQLPVFTIFNIKKEELDSFFGKENNTK